MLMCCYVLSRRSTTRSEHTFISVSFAWSCTNQPEPGASENDAETRSLFYTSRKTVWYRNVLASLNCPQIGPTPTFDDDKDTIAQVLKYGLTSRVIHIAVLVAWLNDQFARELITPVYTRSSDIISDKNSKPHGGQTLQQKTSQLLDSIISLPILSIIDGSNFICLILVLIEGFFFMTAFFHLCNLPCRKHPGYCIVFFSLSNI